ncbi:MAG: hypothetical protein ACM3WV_00150 [Bacillota bacterium]
MKEYQITFEIDGSLKTEIVKAQNTKAAQTVITKKYPGAVIKSVYEMRKKW